MSVQHMPVRRMIGGRVDEAGMRGPRDDRVTAWHYAWNIDERVRLKMRLYQARDAKTTRPAWLEAVWDTWQPGSPDEAWPDGVHPSTLWRLWPRPYTGDHPQAVRKLLERLNVFQQTGDAA